MRNQLGIFILAFFLLVATVAVSVMNNFSTNVFNITNDTYNTIGVNTSQITSFKSNSEDAIQTIITGVNFLIVLITVLTIYSSFVSQNNISSYLLIFVASVFLSSVLIYLFHNIYNHFVLSASTSSLIDLNTFSDFIFMNFDNIILFNMLAFLLSFIFRKVNRV